MACPSDVGIGWYLLGKVLTQAKPSRTALVSLAVGVGWGLWAVWWPAELAKGVDRSAWGFARHSLLVPSRSCSPGLSSGWLAPTGSRAAGWRQSCSGAWSWSSSSRHESPTTATAALILPPLLGSSGFFRRSARTDHSPDLLDGLLGRVRPRNVLDPDPDARSPPSPCATFRSLHRHAPPDQRPALRDHDAPGVLVPVPKPPGHVPHEGCLIRVPHPAPRPASWMVPPRPDRSWVRLHT